MRAISRAGQHAARYMCRLRFPNRTCGAIIAVVPQLRIRDAASFLGVSDDTVRRWVDSGALTATADPAGRMVLDSHAVALLARDQARAVADPSGVGRSARNRFVGLVTDIKRDTVMAQVELQCGPFRVVSLMSSEAVDDLELEPGSVAIAVVKSTTVIIETPAETS
jgi:molybdopterin-binding protein